MRRCLAISVACIGLAVVGFTSSALAGSARARRSDARAVTARSIPAHVPTWAFDDGCNGGANVGPSFVRRWLSYAEADCGPLSNKARVDCHSSTRRYCSVMQYLDTDWEFEQQPPVIENSATDSWWLHEPAPNQQARIFSSGAGGGYLDNQLTPAVQAFYRAYVRRYYSSDQGLLMDWQSPSLTQELYYSSCGCTHTREIHSDNALRLAHQAMAAALTRSNGSRFVQADNTLPPNPYSPQGLDMLDHQIGVDAWTIEGQPESFGVFDPYYSTLLDQMAYVVDRTRGFVVPMSRGIAGAPYETQSRLVQESTILLAFRPGRVVDWANFEDGSPDLAVYPEESIYPTKPVESMRTPRGRGCLAGTGTVCTRGGHNSVQVAPGVYRREFRACYVRSAPFGPCAAIVNATGHAVTVRRSWLKLTFRSEITLAGGDIQSGGSVDLTGAPFRAGATVIAPQSAILLSR